MPAIETAVLERLKANLGPDTVATLIDSFLSDSEDLLTRMRVALPSKDAATLVHAAHNLKSTSRTFGANELSEVCQEIETICSRGMPDRRLATQKVTLAGKRLGSARTALLRHRAKLSVGA